MGKLTLSHPESAHQLILDEETGLLSGIIFMGNSIKREIAITSSINLEIDGSERRAATGGLEYFDTKNITDSKSQSKPQQTATDKGIELSLKSNLGGVSA